MESFEEFKKEALKDPKVAAEYKKLAPRYQLISELIRIRIKKGLTQEELAKKVGTKQSAIARIESGNTNPSFNSIEKILQAMNVELCIRLK